jgi:multidrug transporter EmrE-like cation transporter
MRFLPWLFLVVCVVLSSGADTLGTLYWKKQHRMLLLVVLLIGSLSYVAFGYVGHRFGLSIASSLMNGIIALVSILIGLIALAEWRKVPWPVYAGMVLIVTGILLVAIYRPNMEDT